MHRRDLLRLLGAASDAPLGPDVWLSAAADDHEDMGMMRNVRIRA